MSDLVAEIKKIPPVTRFLIGSTLGVSLPVFMKLVSAYKIIFVKRLVTTGFQLWRLHTSFFLGSSGFGFIFDLVMLYRTSSELETNNYKNRSSDLAWQLFWACGGIIAATLPLNAMILFRPLLLCIVYLYSSLAPPGSLTSIMGLVTIPIKYYPYVLIGMDLIVGGPQYAALSVAGAVVGHLWWWTVWGGELAGRGMLAQYSSAPAWLRHWFGEDARRPPAMGGTAAGLAQGGIHVTAPRRPLGATGSGSAPQYPWGSGQRLGS